MTGLPWGMSFDPEEYRDALSRSYQHALDWLDSVPVRPVRPTLTADELDFAGPFPDDPTNAAAVIDELARKAEPGLMAIPSGKFFGWVMGGTLPAALAADWLVSAWDQNTGLRYATPAAAAIEETAGSWLLEALHLPATAAVGFTTGGTMANMVGLAAGRGDVLHRVGWNLNTRGLQGAPKVTVLAGAEVHASVELALRYLGLGMPQLVESDAQGRLRPDSLALALAETDGPVMVALQAGNLHSGAFDPMRDCIEIAHENSAWVHVDGAFGLWAAASPRWATELDGLDEADSWATDAHKTLNVPYDCGVAIVANPTAARAAFGAHTSYLIQRADGPPDPFELVPELSRRGRGIPVWAALRSLGRSGVVQLVEGLAARARELADALGQVEGIEILNDVAFTQVCLSFGSDERTRAVTRALIEDGEVWMSGSQWSGRDVLRISVSNWSTDAADVATSVQAVRRAMRQAAPL